MSSVASDNDYQTISETGRQRPAWAATLSKEALFRIQLSLSSRRSSVMVLETVCRIFSGTLPQSGERVRVVDVDPADTKWTYQTTGVPGLLVEYKDVKDMTVFSLKLVVVELESGLCTWEGKFGTTANYQVRCIPIPCAVARLVSQLICCVTGVCRGLSHLLDARPGPGGD